MLEDKALQLEYQIGIEHYRQLWFSSFKESIPKILAFWGTMILLAFLGMFFFRNSVQEFLFSFCIAFILIVFLLWTYGSSYINHMNQIKKELANVHDSKKTLRFIFREAEDGFDYLSGKDFSHISWDSIQRVDENVDTYCFFKGSSRFAIPKSAFRNASEINFFRNLVVSKLGSKTKLLN